MLKEFESTVLDVKMLTKDTVSCILECPKEFDFKAGQYVLVGIDVNHPKLKGKSITGAEGKKIRRAYSIVNSPSVKGTVEVCVKRVEPGVISGVICELKKGEKVTLIGPFGHFLVRKTDRDLVFVAVGVGIAPFVSMITNLLEKDFPQNIILVKGARSEKDKLYDKVFIDLEKKYDNFKFHNVLSRPDEDFENTGYVQNFLAKYVKDSFNSDYYLCGLQNMIEDVKEVLKMSGVPVNQIFYEKFD